MLVKYLLFSIKCWVNLLIHFSISMHLAVFINIIWYNSDKVITSLKLKECFIPRFCKRDQKM
ncbi:hypothetical protein CF027_18875 [Klebsiella pneumoniae]|nr:hypothetical protein [Klebsiella pneumoniae]